MEPEGSLIFYKGLHLHIFFVLVEILVGKVLVTDLILSPRHDAPSGCVCRGRRPDMEGN
jgi:hypothetical protein